MDRKGKLSGFILTSWIGLTATGCIEAYEPSRTEERVVTIAIECPSFMTKSGNQEEDRINDMNLIIFEDGKAEYLFWESGLTESDDLKFETVFVKGRSYSLFAMANAGKRLEVENWDDLEKITVETSEEGFYDSGIPMSAFMENIPESAWSEISLELVRMAAKISISMDRSRLSKDVEMTVRSIRIGNYPRYAFVAGPSKVTSVHDRYDTGQLFSQEDCDALNHIGQGGRSKEISLYMFENMQGEFPYEITDDEEKIIDENNMLYNLASYVELEIDYRSKELISYDSNLLYRFYLGGSRNDLDIERNFHYHITVTPEDDGLSGGGWRVDKSGIGPSVPFFRMMPADIVEGHIGDTVRVWCECYPRTSPFNPGYEELDYDKSRGIYDYKVDDDGHGVTLYLKRKGTGMVYMSAGAPIDEEGLVLVVVYP